MRRCQHYGKLIIPRDLNFITRNLPADVRKLLRSTPGLILGGGFIRGIIAGEKVSDIDLFGPNQDLMVQKAIELATFLKEKVHVTDNAFTVLSPPRRPVQFIHRWTFNDPIKCVVSFDFTVCQAGIWWQEVDMGEITADEQGNTTGHATIKHTWKSYCHENFYSDLAAKRLVYTYPVRLEDAGGSFLRVRKFLMRGYNIQSESLAGVTARMCLGVDEIKKAFPDIRGGEQWLAQILQGLMLEVDPLVVTDEGDVIEDVEPVEEKAPVDIRDPDSPCEYFAPGEPAPLAICQTDGHYRCAECQENVHRQEEDEEEEEATEEERENVAHNCGADTPIGPQSSDSDQRFFQPE